MKLLEIPAENRAAAPCRAPSLPPCWGAVGVCRSQFHLVTSKAVSQKASLCPRYKIAVHFHPESFDGAAVGCRIQYLSPSLLFSKTFGFPSLSPAQPRAGQMEGCSRQLPLCSSSWVQQDLAFNYKVLFPTSAWLLTPSLPGTCTTGGNAEKTPTQGSLGKHAWCCIAEGLLAEMRPHLPSSHFSFCLLFQATSFVQQLGFLWAQLFPSRSHPLPQNTQFQCLAAVSLTGPLHSNKSRSVCLVIKVKG